jgi:hypothetical protein
LKARPRRSWIGGECRALLAKASLWRLSSDEGLLGCEQSFAAWPSWSHRRQTIGNVQPAFIWPSLEQLKQMTPEARRSSRRRRHIVLREGLGCCQERRSWTGTRPNSGLWWRNATVGYTTPPLSPDEEETPIPET